MNLLTTLSEQSDFVRTGRYEEVPRLAKAFQEHYPDLVSAWTFGLTPEGRPMQALVLGRVRDSATARANGRPVLLFQGGIHPGEIEGKDAGFLFVRDLLGGKIAKNALDHVTIVFIPVLNVDGHERMTPNNRPNQNGPAEMGWRTNGLNLNLNRDYTKIEAPETAALMKLLEMWDPVVYVDMHATNGAEFETDLSLLIDPADAGPPTLKPTAAALSTELIARLAAKGHITVPFYPTLRLEDRPESGFELAPLSPRYSQGYWGARNRMGVLVETHSWRPYKHRVKTCYNILEAMTEMAVSAGDKWVDAARATDGAAPALAGKSVPLTHKATSEQTMLDFKGYEYTYEYSWVSNAPWVKYHRDRPATWRVPYYGTLAPDVVVTAPLGGYVIPAAFARDVGEKLSAHGIAFSVLGRAMVGAPTETFRATDVRFTPRPFEGRQQLAVDGSWRAESRDIPEGSLFVPARQARLRLALYLLEPMSPDSLLAWGFFNAAFERKEYMESYVAEGVARDMLRDPKIKAEFDARVASDAAFAASPTQRLEFFFRRHSAWDDRMDLYPIYRTQEVLPRRPEREGPRPT